MIFLVGPLWTDCEQKWGDFSGYSEFDEFTGLVTIRWVEFFVVHEDWELGISFWVVSDRGSDITIPVLQFRDCKAN